MEGREQKHQMIAKYQHQSIWKDRWATTFRHEFIHIGYLRLNGFDRKRYKKKNVNSQYIPTFEADCCQKCGGVTSDEGLCFLCEHKGMAQVKEALVVGASAASANTASARKSVPKSAQKSRKSASKTASKNVRRK